MEAAARWRSLGWCDPTPTQPRCPTVRPLIRPSVRRADQRATERTDGGLTSRDCPRKRDLAGRFEWGEGDIADTAEDRSKRPVAAGLPRRSVSHLLRLMQRWDRRLLAHVVFVDWHSLSNR